MTNPVFLILATILLLAPLQGCPANLATNDKGVFRQKSPLLNQTPEARIDSSNAELSVVPGISLGHVNLGASFNDVENIFPVRKQYDAVHRDMTFKIDGTTIHCADVFHRAPFPDDRDIFFYFKGDRLVQIEGSSREYNAPNGVKLNTRLPEVVKVYPNASLFLSSFSSDKKFDPRNKLYLVDGVIGISFRFAYDVKAKGYRVDQFIVFPAGDEFLPETCVTEPQRFNKISLEELESEVND